MSCAGDWPGEALTPGAPVAIPDGLVRLAAAMAVDVAAQQLKVYGATFGPLPDASLISTRAGGGNIPAFPGLASGWWRMT